jgi:hypothetical protein
MLMQGITLEFMSKVETSRDALNNPVTEIVGISVDDCLIAPLGPPTNVREQQAVNQARDQVTIHLPKTFTADLSGSYIAWSGHIFKLNSSSVPFMNENTPTRWNRYFTAESVAQYDSGDVNVWLHFFITEDSQYYLAQETSS